MSSAVLSWWKGHTGLRSGQKQNELPVPMLWAFPLLPTPQHYVTKCSLSMCWVERAPRPPSHKGVPWVLDKGQEADFLLSTLRSTWMVRAEDE